MECRLCESVANKFFTDLVTGSRFYHCPRCDLRFLDPDQYLSAQDEEKRYKTHNNVVEDEGYQAFTMPMVELIKKQHKVPLQILDFGCGNGPVINHLLTEPDYKIALYDPFFYPDREVLKRSYDFIAMIEVAEHLYNPAVEFKLLCEMLKGGGELGVMTALFDPSIDFATWWYRRDPTHVCFYSEQTVSWICRQFSFTGFKVHSPRLFSLLIQA